MRQAFNLTGTVILVGWLATVGCNRAAVREKALPDPLLTSKKPIEGKPHLTESNLRDELIPPPPPLPQAMHDSAAESSVVQMLRPQHRAR